MIYLPSTYIRFWWFYRKLDTSSFIDMFFLTLVMIQLSYKILDSLQKDFIHRKVLE